MKIQSIILILCSMLLSSCEEIVQEVEFDVRTLNERNKPITNANVHINNVFEGRTNSQGFFKTNKELNPNERVFIEVKKKVKHITMRHTLKIEL